MKAASATLSVPALLVAALLVGATGCASTDPPDRNARPTVFACVAPHGYFARRIAGGLVDVQVLVRDGVNPHTFAPTTRDMVALSRADLYFRAGLGFEDALCGKLAGVRNGPRIIDTRAGLDLLDETEHAHDGHTDHAGLEGARNKDPHAWLSPKLAARQAATIRDAMCEQYPAHADVFARNAAELSAELDAMDARIAKVLAGLKGRKFFVFHPAFGYFAAAYDMRQEAVETGGKSPSLKDINRLIAEAKADKVRVIFVQPQFSTQAAQTIAAEIGGVVVPIDPLAGDYIANMDALAESVRSALSGESDSR